MNLKTLVCGMALATYGFSAQADTIYDSTGAANGNAFSLLNGQEIGNEITVKPGSTWTLTNFTIQYYSPTLSPNLAANVGIDVRFYLNNGTPTNNFATPGSLLWDSTWFFNPPTGLPAAGTNWVVTYTTADFGSLVLPGDFTFTVSFTNLNGGNQVDLPLANNMSNSISQSFGDYWLNNGGNWTLMTNSGSAANFVASFAGTVPEPSTVALGIGGAALLGINRLRRKR